MRITCLLFSFFSFLNLQAQDLTGTWEGYESGEYCKLVIVKTGDQYAGYTYDEGMGYCKANFKGSFDTNLKKLKGRGDGMIEKTLLHTQCIYSLQYYKEGHIEYLSGLAWPKSIGSKILSFGIPLRMKLSKVKDAVDTTEYMAKKMAAASLTIPGETFDTVMAVLNDLDRHEQKIISIKQERSSDTIQMLTVAAKKLKVSIFDNGVTDGDSISIIYNNRLIASNISVSGNPFHLDLELDRAISIHSFTLVALNVGSIPPNTATIIIDDGKEKYRLSARSDLNRNAVILIKEN